MLMSKNENAIFLEKKKIKKTTGIKTKMQLTSISM